ncbi:MAG: hypothetical protein MMC23_004008 [Stictis urceolatum]|nr:hypothetical protein [Stictis urceolata]
MSICALSAARLRDGASPSQLRADPIVFGRAAEGSISNNIKPLRGLDYMRACTMMALYHIQNGQRDEIQHYMGTYINIVALDGLHDESRWPKDISVVETEERRRLFWSMYNLDVFTATIWAGFVRIRETQCSVSFPSEIDGEQDVPPGLNDVSWMHGWNFTTELYRVLEHILDTPPRRQDSRSTGADIIRRYRPQLQEVRAMLHEMYARLEPRFKDMQRGDHGLSDKFSFQAANIAATFQLVRIVLCKLERPELDIKVQTCVEFLDEFSKVPALFLKAISAPLLHHVSAIGAVLGSVIQGPISFTDYAKVRGTLDRIIGLLEYMEIGRQSDVSSSEPLRAHISRIDTYMQNQQMPSNLSSSSMVSVPTATMPFQYFTRPAGTGSDNTAMTDLDFEIQLPQELLDNFPWFWGAPDGYAPELYAPGGYAPGGYAPDGYAPDGYAPNGYEDRVIYEEESGSQPKLERD